MNWFNKRSKPAPPVEQVLFAPPPSSWVSPRVAPAIAIVPEGFEPTIRLAAGWRVDPNGHTDLEQARDMLALLPQGPAFDIVTKMINEIREYREYFG